MSNKPNLLFVGAHHDDLELGAGGLIKATVSSGYTVGFVILTDSDDCEEAEIRREETISGLTHLGANVNSIAFASLRDGNVVCNRNSVDLLRLAAGKVLNKQSIVVSHTRNDAHIDHIFANQLVEASFRDVVFMEFAIPNSLIISRFKPALCVDIQDNEKIKFEAILKHESQYKIGRIDECNIENIHRKFRREFNRSVCEVFEEVHLFGNYINDNPIDYLINDGIIHRSII